MSGRVNFLGAMLPGPGELAGNDSIPIPENEGGGRIPIPITQTEGGDAPANEEGADVFTLFIGSVVRTFSPR